MKKKIRQLLKKRVPLFGGWNSLGHPSITEFFTSSGLDFIGIDLEHSTISLEQTQNMIAVTQAKGLASLPRVSSHNGEQIKRVLESGADGVIVPMVNNAKEVDQIVDWVKYSPVGKRSFGVGRAQNYGFDYDTYVSEWNERSVIIVQIESIEGVNNIESIIKNKYVDGVMIGPYDMSGSLGIPGQLDHPKVKEACQKVIDACKKHNMACGNQIVDPTVENVREALDQGFTFAILSSDVFLLWKWGERMKDLISQVEPAVKK